MKDGLKYIVGKRIAAVVVASSKQRSPHNQVFLVFFDGSRFELYGDNFSCCGGLDDASRIPAYVKSGQGEIVRVYDKPLAREEAADGLRVGLVPKGVTDSTGRLERDAEAWKAARAAIAVAAKNSRP